MPNQPLRSTASALMQVPPIAASRTSAEDGIRRIRNQLRKYSVRSVVDAALNALWTDHGSDFENLKAAPWVSMLLAKWAVADRMAHINIGPAIPQPAFDRLRQAVWELPHRNEGTAPPTSAMALVRPLLQQQMEFQRPQGWGFVRWPALIASRPPSDAISMRFRESLGMDPDTFIDLSWGLHVSILERKPNVPNNFFAPLIARYGQSVHDIVSLFTRDLAALRAELGKPDALNVRGRAELREFSYLRRFPFVRLSPNAITCWHPAVLARGMEDAVHLRLSDFGEQYTRPFSKLFESYVIELSIDAVADAVPEALYESALGPEASMVEAIIREPQCNVLVEAKMSLFADSVLASDNPNTIYQKTKRVYEAFAKGWKVTLDLADSTNPFHRPDIAENYLLIVVSRQLHVGTGPHLAEIYPTGRLDYPDETAATRLPLRHVFILSIEDFERATAAVRSGVTSFQQMLRKVVLDNAAPESAKMYFSHHLDQYDTVDPRLSKLIAAAVDASRARLEKALTDS